MGVLDNRRRSCDDYAMTNNERINMTANNDRRIADLRRIKEELAAPIYPAIVRRPPPKTRRNSVPHRSIR